ncbi:hypothetical protein [Xenorhabdus ehlersii]|uniref:Uncharacterized protein n=1 Tax=Xenorhabdus ehlersii TaxID=290111 RepID=A0A2D0ISZ5_9GAMM|nr:hypothetical protein [Xenorhabdus ehlersii]PHM24445.1 hypothetical protein Xehl_02125 [Xenorhabdus ehlersii]PHM24975.1 hypothetical protein Xehl_01760 [Xenorhabdus ehlersii]RKE87933.1 hypothetical protein BDE27_3479 [Xenorhabdus ehlersii]
MKNFLFVLLLGAFYIPASFADTSVTNSQKITDQGSSRQGMLRECTDLLPTGHKYTINIIGTSDKTTQDPKEKFTGKFIVSDESKQDISKKRADEIKPFIQCVTEKVL